MMPLNKMLTGCQTAISVVGFKTALLHNIGYTICYFIFTTVKVNVAAGMFCIEIQKLPEAIHWGSMHHSIRKRLTVTKLNQI